MNKKNCLIRVDKDTKEKLKRLKREIGVLEERDISLGEIIERITKGEDISARLKIGALERKRK